MVRRMVSTVTAELISCADAEAQIIAIAATATILCFMIFSYCDAPERSYFSKQSSSVAAKNNITMNPSAVSASFIEAANDCPEPIERRLR